MLVAEGETGSILSRGHSAIFGLEPSVPLFNAYLDNSTGFQCTTLESANLSTPFDQPSIITALDVLEPIENPISFFQQSQNLLPPGTVLVIETPNLTCPMAKFLGRRWHTYHPYHLSYSRPENLQSLASADGFVTIHKFSRKEIFSLKYLMLYFLVYMLKCCHPKDLLN